MQKFCFSSLYTIVPQYPAITVCMYDINADAWGYGMDLDSKTEDEEFTNELKNIISRHIYFKRFAKNG